MTIDSPVVERPASLRGEARQLTCVLAASLACRIGYLLMKPAAAVSLDMRTWRTAIHSIREGVNPYLDGSFNWPPPWPQIVAGLSAAMETLGIGFDPLFWGVLILIECALIGVTFDLLRQSVSARHARNILLLAIALNPAAILQVTQHGSLHVLLMLWVMLAIGAIERFAQRGGPREWLRACAFLGLGALTKVIPLALAPLLAGGLRKLRPGIVAMGALLLLGPLAIAVLGVVMISPPGTWKHLVLYRSVHGYFGISGLAAMADGVEFPAVGPVLRLHAVCFLIFMPLVLGAIALRLHRRDWPDPAPVALAAGLILLIVVTFGTGFGPQYIYWLIPPLAVAWARVPDRRWRGVLVSGLVVVAVTYSLDYGLSPGLGAVIRKWAPDSTTIYRMQQDWLLPADQTLMRLPMFGMFVAILIEGFRVLRRASMGAGSSPV